MQTARLCPQIVTRGSDILGVVEARITSKLRIQDISNATLVKLPKYTPDNISVLVIFHTEKQVRVLGNQYSNPVLKDMKTSDGTQYPEQIRAAIGGAWKPSDKPDRTPDASFKDAMLEMVKTKLFLEQKVQESAAQEAQTRLQVLSRAIESNEGWEDKVCVHTDHWSEGEKDVTMSVLTGIKHIECSEKKLEEILADIKTLMQALVHEGTPQRWTMNASAPELDAIVQSSIASHMQRETTKAEMAYETFQDKVAVTFNDLAVAALAKNGAFQQRSFAPL